MWNHWRVLSKGMTESDLHFFKKLVCIEDIRLYGGNRGAQWWKGERFAILQTEGGDLDQGVGAVISHKILSIF